MQCFKCEKPLQMMPDMPTNPDDAGEFVLSFHYGSRHDQCYGFEGRKAYLTQTEPVSRCRQLEASDQIRGYVCDDCFEKFAHLLDGWDVKTTRTEGKVV